MPTGFTDSLTPVAALIEWLQPQRVLDIGVGNGRMGFLAREYGHQPWNPRARGDGVELYGIEGYEPYISDLQRAIYDRIVIGEARGALQQMASAGEHYDLAIAADIIEHFTPSDGRLFLERCLAVSDLLLVATPRAFFEQEGDDNEFEVHRSHWPEEELLRAGAAAILHRGDSLVALFGNRMLSAQYRARRPPLRHRLLPPAVLELGHAGRARWRVRRGGR